MRIKLDPNNLEDYRKFLQIKSLPTYRFVGREAIIPDEYAARLGVGPSCPAAAAYRPIPGLFDYQRDITRIAIEKGKFAVFAQCFVPGALVHADGRYRPIEECSEGMRIETLVGPASIERTMSRHYSGEIIKLTTASGFHPISVTLNHKFYVLRRKRCVIPSRSNTLCSPLCNRNCPVASSEPHASYHIEIVEARDLTVDDCLLFRQPDRSSESPISDAMLKLAGLWLAEGHLSRQSGKLYGIHLAFHRNEESTLVAEALRCFDSIGIRARIERREKDNVLLVCASNNEFAEWLSSQFGEKSHRKHLPGWFFKLPAERQLILLTGLFEGDSHINMRPAEGRYDGRLSESIRYVTVSYELASGVRDALLGMGIRCSAMTEKSKIDRNGVRHKEAYRILIPRRFMDRFGYQIPVIRRDLKQVEHAEHGQRYTLIPIRKIERSQYSGLVYNLTSSGHDSYLTDAGTSKNCGLGKTLVLLEFARHARRSLGPSRRVLIVSPLMVIPQTIDAVRRFYEDAGHDFGIEQVRARDLPAWTTKPGSRVGITNYEALTDDVPQGRLGALILDESSMLKSHYGKHGQQCLRLGAGLNWKLCLTGTPAPNDRIEYANHAVFLDAFPTINSFLARYFVNRGQTGERWELKPHALEPFYRSLSHWCIFLESPATYGWKDNTTSIPTINVHIHDVDLTAEQREMVGEKMGTLFAGDIGGITKRSTLSQIAKGNYKGRKIDTNKPAFIRDLVASWPDESTIIWCLYNAEQEELENVFPDAASIAGSTPVEKRWELIADFQAGRRKVLISKPSVLGFGLNLQIATRQVFSGLQDSFEEYHQAVKRSNRIGSTRPLNVHIPVSDVERPMIETVLKKAHRVQQDTEVQERLFREQSFWRANDVA